jgi:GT2 family glycosyltransferase
MPEFLDNPSDSNPIPVFGFIHVATKGTWRDVFAEQLELLRRSGLYDRSSRIYVGIVGPEADSFEVSEDKIAVIYRSPDFCEYEFPTLRFLKTFCSTHAGLVYYLHSKGVFRNSATTEDWRRYMQYFVIERYAECIRALEHFDICGVNWQELPWPHFSGNFWWATYSYVAKLPELDRLLPVVEGWDQQERHQCERWIGSGVNVRPASLHQSHSDHYKFEYPRSFYAGPPKDALYSHLRIALIFDNLVRRDTTGIYCLRALRQLTHVSHFLPYEMDLIPREVFNLFLYIDDGLDYPLPSALRPSAMWAIDTHLNPQRLIRRAATVDFVFAAQRDGVELLRDAGIDCIGWLPLACDPEVHVKVDVSKTFDVSFVAHLSTPDRLSLAKIVQDRFPNCFVGQRFFTEMAETYSASRVVINQSVRNDINMRVFEALACGSLLITNDLADNGQGQLLTEGIHYISSRDINEFESKIRYYLTHSGEREAIAAAGRIEALSRHTYWHRMNSLLEAVVLGHKRAVTACPRDSNVPAISALRPRLTSIIILTHNQLDYTRQCLGSIREKTHGPYELIVVDNGSTDETLDYLQRCPDLLLIENNENRGFPAGVNQGIAASTGDRIVLLNNDTIVSTDWLYHLLQAMDSDPRIGLVGPLSNGSLGPQFTQFSNTNISEIEHVANSVVREYPGLCEDVWVLSGFCLMIRREVIDRIGQFDEAFGIGTYDDYEYCRRAASVGYRLVVASAYVHHFGAVTLTAAGIDVPALLQKNQLFFEARCKTHSPLRDRRARHDVLTSIVLVTFNGVNHTRACLESLAHHTPERHEIIVVDNGSSDGTISFLRSQASVRFIQNDTNRGFPAAANQGLRAAAGERILLLNNDVIVTPGWLKRMLDVFDRFSDVGLVGPCSNEVSGAQRVCIAYNTLEDLNRFASSRADQYHGVYEDVPRLVGFCLLLRREVMDRVGLLDERFGIGNFEDDDYCRRSILAGFRAVIARDSFVHHVGSATFKAAGTDYAGLLERNRQLYLEKWSSPKYPQRAAANPPPQKPSDGQPCAASLSLCMIVRNSSRTLRACLESIRPFVDEMIVVDTGSSDDTVRIAQELGATVGYFPWCDDFSAARNESIAAEKSSHQGK